MQYIGRRIYLVLAFVAVIATGIALRMFGYTHLPYFLVKYGGSALWGAMVYVLLAALAPHRQRGQIAAVSFLVAVCVELFRLVHTPWLDQFRLTLAGALLLGRIFSFGNMVAYGVGIVLAFLIDAAIASGRGGILRVGAK